MVCRSWTSRTSTRWLWPCAAVRSMAGPQEVLEPRAPGWEVLPAAATEVWRTATRDDSHGARSWAWAWPCRPGWPGMPNAPNGHRGKEMHLAEHLPAADRPFDASPESDEDVARDRLLLFPSDQFLEASSVSHPLLWAFAPATHPSPIPA